jgi:hypothetical protein
MLGDMEYIDSGAGGRGDISNGIRSATSKSGYKGYFFNIES